MIEYPFLGEAFVDTARADVLLEGPTVEQMRRLESEQGRRFHNSRLRFLGSSYSHNVEVIDIVAHPIIPDSWWIQGVIPEDLYCENVGILWTPGRQTLCFLVDERELILQYD